jgi:hypothetical protein
MTDINQLIDTTFHTADADAWLADADAAFLTVFLSLKGEEQAARWRGLDHGAKFCLVVRRIEQLGKTWMPSVVEAQIAKYDERFASGPIELAVEGALERLALEHSDAARLAVRGLIVVGDVPLLVQLSVKSTMTDHLLAALLDHYRVCAAADSIIKRDQHPDPVAFHELALPLIAGAEQPAGKGETAQIAPLQSDHPAAIEKAYITSCWRKNALHEAALAAWPGIVAWAAGYRTGETNGDSHLSESLL